MHVRTHEFSDLPKFLDSWEAMIPETPAGFFLRPEWCHLVWNSFGNLRGSRIHVARKGGEVVGILPVWRRRMNRFGLYRTVCEAFGGARGDYSHPLLADCTDDEALRALLASAIQRARRDGALVLANVPDQGRWSGRIRLILESEGVPFTESRRDCLRIELPPTFDEYSASVRSRLRTDVRRRLRKLEAEVGPLEFERLTDPEDARLLLPRLFDLHDRRWLDTGRPGAFSDPRMRQYFAGMVESLWPHLHITVLRAQGETVALHFGMASGRNLLHFKPTFEPDLGAYSPGKLQLWKLIEQAIEEGFGVLDFLQGEEGYKNEWANGSTGTSTFVIRTRRASVAYWWLSGGRAQVERRFGRAYLRFSAAADRIRRGQR